MAIRVHIDKVVLDGLYVSPAQKSALRETIQRELRRMIVAEHATRPTQSKPPNSSADGGIIQTPQTPNPQILGSQIAAATLRGMKR